MTMDRFAAVATLTLCLAGCAHYSERRASEQRAQFLQENAGVSPEVAAGIRQGVPVVGMTVAQLEVALLPAKATLVNWDSDGNQVFRWWRSIYDASSGTETLYFFEGGELQHWSTYSGVPY